MTPTPRHAALATAMTLLLAVPAAAQTVPTQPAGPRPAAAPLPAPDRCAEPRGLLAAEATTPGILQVLMREALAACEAQQPQGAAGAGR